MEKLAKYLLTGVGLLTHIPNKVGDLFPPPAIRSVFLFFFFQFWSGVRLRLHLTRGGGDKCRSEKDGKEVSSCTLHLNTYLNLKRWGERHMQSGCATTTTPAHGSGAASPARCRAAGGCWGALGSGPHPHFGASTRGLPPSFRRRRPAG